MCRVREQSREEPLMKATCNACLRIGAIMAAGAVALGLLLGTSAVSAQQPKIKIGLMLPYTGTFAALGTNITNGFKLAIAENGGKLAGREIEYFTVDDEWQIIDGIRARGIATLIVDKNYRAVTAIADRNVILVKGRVVFEGDSATLKAQPDVLQRHLGV